MAKKLLIFGAGGMVGSALVRAAEQRGYTLQISSTRT